VEPRTDRIEIEYTLTFATLFHCGTGIREGLVDRTVVRNNQGHLYIPGSTFKGVLRERCEQLARAYVQGEQEKQRIASPHDAQIALLNLGRKPTMITRIFGSQNIPGSLFFDDAMQRGEDALLEIGQYKELQVGIYTQVRIDRPTHTAVPGALYTSEFGTKDTEFKGTIQGWLSCVPVDRPGDTLERIPRIDLAPTYSLLLLLAGLQLVERLGGNKSTGKGQCECRITSVAIRGGNCPETLWKSWLSQLDVLTQYQEVLEG
jgi:CRISPR/Cas system CSM-associated protein Csm3 (group 7 of RAMP superfamily)